MWPISILINNSITYIDTLPKRLEQIRYKLPGPGGPARGLQPHSVAYILGISP